MNIYLVLLSIHYLLRLYLGLLYGDGFVWILYLKNKGRFLCRNLFLLSVFFAAVSNFLQVFPSANLEGPLQQVLLQALIPVTMIISFFVLKAQYKWNHLVGSVLIIGGVLFGVLPQVNVNACQIFWILLYISSVIPRGVQNVAREKWLKEYDFNVWYFNAWDTFLEIFVGILILPTVLISYPGEEHITLNNLPEWLLNGTLCFFWTDDSANR